MDDVFIQTPSVESCVRLDPPDELAVWLDLLVFLYACVYQIELVAQLPDTDHVVTSLTVPKL